MPKLFDIYNGDLDDWFTYELSKIINKRYLIILIYSKVWLIRRTVVDRIKKSYLKYIIFDGTYNVRIGVSNKIDHKYLHKLMNDKNKYVKRAAIKRLKIRKHK